MQPSRRLLCLSRSVLQACPRHYAILLAWACGSSFPATSGMVNWCARVLWSRGRLAQRVVSCLDDDERAKSWLATSSRTSIGMSGELQRQYADFGKYVS